MQNSTGPLVTTLLVIATAFVVFLPIIVALARGRPALVMAAFLLSVGSVAGSVISSAFGVGALLVWPICGGAWLAGLLCGLAAYLDRSADDRSREIARRLLSNDNS